MQLPTEVIGEVRSGSLKPEAVNLEGCKNILSNELAKKTDHGLG